MALLHDWQSRVSQRHCAQIKIILHLPALWCELLRMAFCVQLEEDLRVLRHEIRQSGETGVQLPVNFRRLIWNAQKIFKCKPHRPGPSGNWNIISIPC